MVRNLKIYLIFILLSINFAFAGQKVYENAEDGKINRWHIVKGGSSSKIVNLYDKNKKSRVIEFKGLGLKSGYEISIGDTFLKYSFDLSSREKFYLEFAVETDKGIKYLAYTAQDGDYLGKGNFIRFGLGSKIIDGKWREVVLDLQKDLNKAQKDAVIKKVIRFRVYGNLKLDNLQSFDKKVTLPKKPSNFKARATDSSVFLSWDGKEGVKYKIFRDSKLIDIVDSVNSFVDTDLKENTLYTYEILAFNNAGESQRAKLTIKTKAKENTENESKKSVYEDGEDGKISSWVIYDNYPFGAKIENVYDEKIGSRVIKFQGNGVANGYWLREKDGGWRNKEQFIFNMDINFDKDFVFYIKIRTNKGVKYLTYTNTVDENFIYGKYLVIALKDIPKGWFNFKRNLQNDLNLFGKEKLLEVDGLMIRGDGMVDNIFLLDRENFAISKPSDPTNVSIEVNGVDVTLKWEDNTNKKADYKIYRDGKLIKLYKNKGVYSYTDSNLLPNREYKYKITAFLNGVESDGVIVEAVTKESRGRIIYVATDGNDEWSGKYPSPKDGDGPLKTIQYALDLAKPGDTIMVRGGVYPGRVVFKHSGNAKEGYITLRNYPGEKPVITRNDTAMSDTVVGYGVSYIKFMGFHVYKPNREGVVFYGPGSHIIIKNNEISESNANIPETKRLGHALSVIARKDKPMSYITIEANHVHHNHTGNPNRAGAYNEALTVLGNVKYFKIINNEVNDNDFIGIDIIGHQRGQFSVFGMNKYGLVAGNRVYRNGVRKVWASALYVDGAENLIVENNLVYDNFGLGITISQETSESTTDHVIVRHNIGWGNKRGGMIGSANRGLVRDSVFVHNVLGNSSTEADLFLGNAVGWRIKNNIFSSEGEAPFMFKDISNKTSSWIMDYNIYKDISFIQVGRNYRSFSEYKSKSGKDEHSFALNNLYFKDEAKRDFHLKENSEAIDKGGFLTFTSSSGEGRIIEVLDASYFTDGYGLKEGDLIKVGNERVRVVDVNYASNTIEVDRDIKWSKGEGISYNYYGTAPDIGAYEFKE